jgi:hypothetical protein
MTIVPATASRMTPIEEATISSITVKPASLPRGLPNLRRSHLIGRP